ncbi:hypothetical protein EKH57_11820 [Halorubrum sp. BOL3-1]|uniref:hypothetical protein n=1 Tax=Halorubrum sp. BOL3-1 TaxID=2497325 RepID=UPI0010050A2A|nr:hypothetical protein [Halorubrum sp. BOL3-1]QAU13350.1 hypothetical protein EKH57_11820 [Halorubrum sp. BOL3-1]
MTDRDSDDRDDRIVAGAALFNEGHLLAARDVWEAGRRPPDDGGTGGDEGLLRGLAATASATHRAADGDESGAVESAETAVATLEGVPDSRGVALPPVREQAERLAVDPDVSDPEPAGAEDVDPNRAGSRVAPRIRVDGGTPSFDGLSLAVVRFAAPALARAGEPGDAEALATAADLAGEERGTGRTRFAELLFAYLRTPDARPQVAARLSDHVAIEERKRRDVDGLF